MNLSESIHPVTQLKTKSAELIRKARESGQPIIITQNGRATAILQDVDSYQRQQDALHMLKVVAQGAAELDAGRGVTQDEVAEKMAQLLADLRG